MLLWGINLEGIEKGFELSKVLPSLLRLPLLLVLQRGKRKQMQVLTLLLSPLIFGYMVHFNSNLYKY